MEPGPGRHHLAFVACRCAQEIIKDEIAVAYGRRAITKARGDAGHPARGACHADMRTCGPRVACLPARLTPFLPLHLHEQLIDVLALEETELPDDERAHALRVFNGLLSTQEQKTDAISRGAPAPLTKLVRENQDWEVRRNSCEGLASLAQVQSGRAAIAAADGMASLTGALLTTPEAAARAFRVSEGRGRRARTGRRACAGSVPNSMRCASACACTTPLHSSQRARTQAARARLPPRSTSAAPLTGCAC